MTTPPENPSPDRGQQISSHYRDNCPECLTGPYEPYETEVRGKDLVGAYKCTACRHVWPCWWRIEALPADESSAGGAA